MHIRIVVLRVKLINYSFYSQDLQVKIETNNRSMFTNQFKKRNQQAFFNYQYVTQHNSKYTLYKQKEPIAYGLLDNSIIHNLDKQFHHEIELKFQNQQIGFLEIEIQKAQEILSSKKIQIQINRAIFQEDTDVIGKMQPVLIVKLANQILSIPSKSQGKQAIFEQFIQLSKQSQKYIYFEFWEEDTLSYDFLGICKYDMYSDIQGQLELDIVKNMNINGKLYLNMSSRKLLSQEKNCIIYLLGNLKIMIVQAIFDIENMINKHSYIILNLNGVTKQTTKQFGDGRNPIWKQSFDLYAETNEQVINFNIFANQDQFVGSCQSKINQLRQGQMNLPILSDLQQIGTLYLDIIGQIIPKKQLKKIIAEQAQSFVEQQKVKEVKNIIVNSNTQELEYFDKNKKMYNPYKKTQSLLLNNQKLFNYQFKKANIQIKQKISQQNHQFVYDYLKKELNEALSKGLSSIYKIRPEDPINFLGQFLLNYNQ